MDTVYLLFDNSDVPVPFHDYDKGPAGSPLGQWDHAGDKYIVPRLNYGYRQLKNILLEKTGDPFGAGEEGPPEPYSAPGMYSPLYELPGTFSAVWIEKLDAELRARKYGAKARAAYIHQNENLCRWLQKAPPAVTAEDIRQYLAFREHHEGASASSLDLALSAFKFFYRRLLKKDIAGGRRRPRRDERFPALLSKREIKAVLAGEENLKHRLLLMMVYTSGLRVNEAVRLKCQDVDFGRGIVLIHSGKGLKGRYIILSAPVLETLRQYRSENDAGPWIFPGVGPGTGLSVRSARQVCENALKRANIHRHTTAPVMPQ